MEKFLDDVYLIKRVFSHFTSRNGLEDCIIKKRSNYGSRESNGKQYSSIKIFDCKTGELIRDYNNEMLPSIITMSLLKQWGFID